MKTSDFLRRYADCQKNLRLCHTTGITVPAGTYNNIDLRWARRFELADGINAAKIELWGTTGAVIPQNTKCGVLDCSGASMVALPENMVVDEMRCSCVYDMIIPAGFKCNVFSVAESHRFAIHPTAQLGAINAKSAADEQQIGAGYSYGKKRFGWTDEDISRLQEKPGFTQFMQKYGIAKSALLNGARGIVVPAGQYEYINLSLAIYFSLADGIVADLINLWGTYDAKIPANTKCKSLTLANATNFSLPENLVVDELNISFTRNAVLPAGLKCKRLNAEAAYNMTIYPDVELGRVIGSDAEIYRGYQRGKELLQKQR